MIVDLRPLAVSSGTVLLCPRPCQHPPVGVPSVPESHAASSTVKSAMLRMGFMLTLHPLEGTVGKPGADLV